MSLAIALVVVAGFTRTYYLAPLFDQPARAPALTQTIHLHAAVFTLWIVLTVVQPVLIAKGRIGLHVGLGFAGMALAFLVWLFGNAVAVQAIQSGYRGVGDPYAFYAVTFFSIQAYGLIVLLGFLKRHNGEAHKRLMLLSSAAILEAPFGRLPFPIVAETAPLSFYLGADLIIAAGIAYDLIRNNKVHAVWAWGGGLLVASQVLRVAIMNSEPWLQFSHWAASLV